MDDFRNELYEDAGFGAQASSTGEPASSSEIPAASAAESVPPPKKPKRSFRQTFTHLRELGGLCGLPDRLLMRVITMYFLLFGSYVWVLSAEDIHPIDQWQLFVERISLPMSVAVVLSGIVVLSMVYYLIPERFRAIEPFAAIGAVLYFDVALLWRENDLYLAVGVLFVSLVFIGYVLGKRGTDRPSIAIPWPVSGVAVLVAAAVVTGFIAVMTIYRHKIFGSAAHDFGIFVQMFHSLSEDLTAVTTCERDTFLSHFEVHASYIFYVLVPIFKLFPYEETLLIAQAVLAMGGVVPLFLIAKRRGFKGVSLTTVCMAYVFCSALIAPCFYDFHENAFLPTLLMWTLWAADRKSYWPFYIFSALVCIVKEDAPLYIICIGLYLFFEEKGSRKRFHGLAAAVLSGVYMVCITAWLTANGDGQMMTSSRFGHLLTDPEGGFVQIVINTLSNPGYFFSLLIKEETAIFFFQVMLPLLFLPFFTKKIHRFWLMIPFVISNLVIGARYGYAANIGYQYIFGPLTMLLFMTVLNTADMKESLKRAVPVLLGCGALILSLGTVSYHADAYTRYQDDIAYYTELEATLDSIPTEAAIGADAFYVPHIADRDEVYIYDMGDIDREKNILIAPERYDFIVLPSGSETCQTAQPLLEQQGFTVWKTVGDRVTVFKNQTFLIAE